MINVGNELELLVDPIYNDILWSDGSTRNQFIVQYPGRFWVRVENSGCSTSDTIRVSYDSQCRITCPTAFSPNGDGLNGNFQTFSNENLASYNIIIVNRWETIVFESDDIYNSWNGQYNGIPVKQGVYSWIIRYECLYSGEKKVERGTIALI